MSGTLIQASASFTRPNDITAYAANDLVANSTTAGSVVPMAFVFPNGYGLGLTIRGAKIEKTGTSAANANFHVRMYAQSPTVANGDNGAWSSNLSGYMGKLDPAIMEAFTDGSSISDSFAEGADCHCILPLNGTVYGLLVADAAYTPSANEVFTVTLTGEVNR